MHQPRVYGSAAKTEEKLRIPGETEGAPEGFQSRLRTSHKPEDNARHGEQSIGSRSVQLQIGAHASRGPSPLLQLRLGGEQTVRRNFRGIPCQPMEKILSREARCGMTLAAWLRQSWPEFRSLLLGWLAFVGRFACHLLICAVWGLILV